MSRTINVSNAQDLVEALRTATGGETIVLAAGDYGKLEMGRLKGAPEADYASEVRIVSADPEARASFRAIEAEGIRNVTFEGIDFDYVYQGGPYFSRPFQFRGEDVTLRDVLFDGDLEKGPDGDTYGTGFALSMYGSRLTVEDSEFRDWYKAIATAGEDIVIRGNDIHSLRSDGINVSRGEGILIEGNHFHDFARAKGSGDHADMIQFWMIEGRDITRDVTIRENVFDVGEGDPTQTIFMRNLPYDQGQVGREGFYQDILIEENVILNFHHHGISVGATDGLTIRNNTLLQKSGSSDADPDAPIRTPGINLSSHSENVVIEGNVVPRLPGERDGWTVSGNVAAQNTDPDAEGYYGDVLVTSPESGAMPKLRIDIEAGAAATRIAEGELIAGFFVHDSTEGQAVRVFDAAAAMQSAGFTPDEISQMQFAWTFSDGFVAEGPAVRRAFDGAGDYEARLTVATPDGRTAQSIKTTEVPSSMALRLTADGTIAAGLDAALADEGARLETHGDKATIWLKEPVVQRVHEAEAFDVTLSLQADAPGETGLVFDVHRGLSLSTNALGQARLELSTDNKENVTILGPQIGDGGPHEVRIAYDGVAGTISLSVDGAAAATRSFDGEMAGAGRGTMSIGSPWTSNNFEGVIDRFEVEVRDPVVDPYTGATPPAEARPAPAEDAGPTDETHDGTFVPPVEEAALPGPIFDLAEAGAGEVRTRGSAEFVEGEGLSFGSGRSFAGLGKMDPHRDGALTVDLTFDESGDARGAERLLWNHMVFGVELQGDRLRVQLGTEDEGFKRIGTHVEDLGDGTEKDVRIVVDSDLDRIQIVVDGEVVRDSTNVDIDLTEHDRGRGWMVGTSHNRWFEGDVSELRIYEEALFEEPEEKQADDVELLG